MGYQLGEVDLARNINTAIDLYRSLYLKKYGVEPILNASGSDHTLLKDIIKLVGYEKLKEYLEQYFKMKDEFYIRTSHSLITLKTNINRIAVEATKYRSREISQGVEMEILWACDKCEIYSKIIVPLQYNFNNKTLCDGCSV